MEILCCSKVFLVKEIEFIVDRFEDIEKLSEFRFFNNMKDSAVSFFGDSCFVGETDVDSNLLCEKIKRFLKVSGETADKLEGIKSRIDLKIILCTDENYPEYLKQIPDPPAALFAKGCGDLINAGRCIACVGSRKHTNYGKYAVEKIIPGLCGSGFTVVSGMAYGIDSLCHLQCLKEGGTTIAVLGCGVDVVYPGANKSLYDRIAAEGLLLSEYFPDERPRKYYFPERNRIISGLSKGVIVFEATIRSGSLITADCALEQNREVFAVPGPINSTFSEGTNYLIKRGAKLVSSVDDVLEEFGIQVRNSNDSETILIESLSDTERKIYELISDGCDNMDTLVEKTGYGISRLNSSVSMLLINGLIDGDGNNLSIKK